MKARNEWEDRARMATTDAERWAVILGSWQDNAIDWDFDSHVLMRLLGGEGADVTEPVIVVHLSDDGDHNRTACGLPWVPEPENYPKVPRQLCRACARADGGERSGAE